MSFQSKRLPQVTGFDSGVVTRLQLRRIRCRPYRFRAGAFFALWHLLQLPIFITFTTNCPPRVVSYRSWRVLLKLLRAIRLACLAGFGTLTGFPSCTIASVAQLAEQRFCKPQVVGSSPSAGSMHGRSNQPGRRRVQTARPTEVNAVWIYGGIPERSKGSDCKSDGLAFTGSNPVPPTDRVISRVFANSIVTEHRVGSDVSRA